MNTPITVVICPIILVAEQVSLPGGELMKFTASELHFPVMKPFMHLETEVCSTVLK